MKKYIILAMISLATFNSCTKDQIKQAVSTTTGSQDLSDSTIISGLKAALNVGTDSSATQTHRVNGYYLNPFIKIPFPSDAQNIIDAITFIPGGQDYVDSLVLSLNRAAEDAAVKAEPIFINAITGITITDGKNILFGDSLAATSYLQTNTYTSLKAAFMPGIKASLDKVSATKYWATLTGLYNQLPLVTPVNTDLADYTTGKALDGLFFMVGREEKDIRKNPAARVSDILKTVFGQLDKH